MSRESYLRLTCLISPIFRGSNRHDNDIHQEFLVIFCINNNAIHPVLHEKILLVRHSEIKNFSRFRRILN